MHSFDYNDSARSDFYIIYLFDKQCVSAMDALNSMHLPEFKPHILCESTKIPKMRMSRNRSIKRVGCPFADSTNICRNLINYTCSEAFSILHLIVNTDDDTFNSISIVHSHSVYFCFRNIRSLNAISFGIWTLLKQVGRVFAGHFRLFAFLNQKNPFSHFHVEKSEE